MSSLTVGPIYLRHGKPVRVRGKGGCNRRKGSLLPHPKSENQFTIGSRGSQSILALFSSYASFDLCWLSMRATYVFPAREMRCCAHSLTHWAWQMHSAWENRGITLSLIHQSRCRSSVWFREHTFEANLLITAIYHTPACIAKQSCSMQTRCSLDETKGAPGSQLHLLMG